MKPLNKPLELWGGIECTINRVGDGYFSQLERSGHAARLDDLDCIATLGIRCIRYPVLWERTAPDGVARAHWRWAEERLGRIRELAMTPIIGLVHHGSGPRYTSLVDPLFADKAAEYAAAVAERFPWAEYYTPINEPLTTARFSGLYGVWYPHGRDEKTFKTTLFNQCRAVILCMRAVRRVNPAAKLVQTDDLGQTYSTPKLKYQADFNNQLRWLAWDLLCGKVTPDHALWEWLTKRCGASVGELQWFGENACPPDIIGINHYITSDRLLDERLANYPACFHGGNRRHRYADIEAARALAVPTGGVKPLLRAAWERYGLPCAITEAHMGSTRDEQMRWLAEMWTAAREAREEGVDVRAVTVWALLGSYDWDCLVTTCRDYYEPGAFDVRGQGRRPTALAELMRALAGEGEIPDHPVLAGEGWWKREVRFISPPVSLADPIVERTSYAPTMKTPLLIIGATGTLGRAFARICEKRGLEYRLLGRQEADIADAASMERAMDCYRPWAVINAAGYVRVDEAETDAERCFRENTLGPYNLATICARHGIPFVTFSTDLVFDGKQQSPYVESDRVSPLNVYGKSKAQAECRVLERHPASLVVRTSSFFGPWDEHNFITLALRTLRAGRTFVAANDLVVSPTYVPDLVNACLDLLIDRETGIWHLTNDQPITWADLALRAAALAEVDCSNLQCCTSQHLGYIAKRPSYSAMNSQRAPLMPSLESALSRYLVDLNTHARSSAG